MRASFTTEEAARAKHGPEFLRRLVEEVAPHAVVPVSKFHVGAAGLGRSGRVFVGTNLEFEGLPLANSVHAEQSVFCLMAHAAEPLVRLAINYAPCGHCRQFLKEARDGNTVEVDMISLNVQSRLEALLPASFGPRDLGQDVCMFELKHHSLALERSGDESALVNAALSCLNQHCHAPYSGALSAVGIETKSGAIACGAYIESAAYNPSLPPGQCAIVNLVAANLSFDSIARVVLLELASASISHLRQTEQLFQSVAKSVRVERVPLKAPSSKL
jgi:cytidine deaminase